ncbi:MAG: DNA-deoxyinosine glycosylase [Coprobacillus sp.]
MKAKHNIQPIYDKESELLILGSFPSVKSREAEFFYHHPQNRFWKIFETIENIQLKTIEDKENFLLSHHIALWDVIESCEIHGSSDSSIQDVKTNDILQLIEHSSIKHIITNGKKAHALYQKYCYREIGINDICLPSTSPANAAYSLDKLVLEYQLIYQYLSIHI